MTKTTYKKKHLIGALLTVLGSSMAAIIAESTEAGRQGGRHGATIVAESAFDLQVASRKRGRLGLVWAISRNTLFPTQTHVLLFPKQFH